MDERLIRSYMRKQHGLISRAQALQAGMTRHQVQHHLDMDRWRAVAVSVYQNAAVPETPRSRLLAACIAHGGLASHRAAAAAARWHHNRESFVKDRRRRNQLQAAGWDVLNFTWDDYASRPTELCAVVARAYAAD